MSDADMVRVQWHATYSDAIAGATSRDGLSDPVQRRRAERLVACLGAPAAIVEITAAVSVGPAPEATSPVLEPSPSADAGDAAPLSPDSDASVASESPPADAPEEPAAPAETADAASPDGAPAKPRKTTR